MTRLPWITWTGIVGCVLSCSTWHAQPLPTPVSKIPSGGSGLRAGVARLDITPPPGVGLGGSGPEGRRSTGYRTRLYVGALVLEDPTGERIALVVMDLPHVSANLHRLAAERLVNTTGIGADRLIVSATHTHSGPAHFYGERQYNANVSRVPGYDPAMMDHLVERITAAVTGAATSLRPAVIAWGSDTITGATYNRSFEAFCLNPEVDTLPLCDSVGTKVWQRDSAVDRAFSMLRVDEVLPNGDRAPLGTYSVFALHGTSIPSLNTLLDGDAHVRIVERLQRHADSIRSGTVHILANGAEGDVGPKISRSSCDLPAIGVMDAVWMPRGPGATVDFIEPSAAKVEHCIEDALQDLDSVVARVAEPAVALYDALESKLTASLAVRRGFTTAWLPGTDWLCSEPVVGSATGAGAEGLESRVRGWRWLFPFIKIALEEGGAAVDTTEGACHSPKLPLLEVIQGPLVVGEHGFPETAQLTVVRIGGTLLAAVPAEVTTIAARRIRQAMAAAADSSSPPRLDGVVLIGLANGFLQYVTTEEEYQWQAYEGGSNLYGPGMGRFLERRLAALSAGLSDGASPSPVVQVGAITGYPGPATQVLPSRTAGPDTIARNTAAVRCDGGRVVAEWTDLAPGRIFPRDSAWVRLEASQDTTQGWTAVALDGDGQLEVHALKSKQELGWAWRAVWRHSADGRWFRLVRLDHPGWYSNVISCPGR